MKKGNNIAIIIIIWLIFSLSNHVLSENYIFYPIVPHELRCSGCVWLNPLFMRLRLIKAHSGNALHLDRETQAETETESETGERQADRRSDQQTEREAGRNNWNLFGRVINANEYMGEYEKNGRRICWPSAIHK